MAHPQRHSKARQLGQFYTNPKTALACISHARKQLAHLQLETTIEPSAGAGAFANQLGQSCIAIDIDPKQEGMIRANFLTWQPHAQHHQCLVIGNPPFGRNASLAVKFFNHAASFADAIAFIVPLSFRKTSIQRRLDRNFHLISTLPLPGEFFLLEGQSRQVPCEFQIWERRNMPREIEKLARTHPDFEFCSREHADFAVQRVGAKAGRIKDIAEAGSASSHYFVRATGSADRLRTLFEAIDFDMLRQNCAAVPSIAKTEIIALYAAASKKWQSSAPQNPPTCSRHDSQTTFPKKLRPDGLGTRKPNPGSKGLANSSRRISFADIHGNCRLQGKIRILPPKFCKANASRFLKGVIQFQPEPFMPVGRQSLPDPPKYSP